MKSFSRRDFMKGLTIAASASVIPAFAERPRPKRPNVIILFIDDLAYGELGAFGCPDIPTPHMDSLAAKGVKCTNSYITNPPCSPSRCCLMTGMYTQKFGKYGMARGLPIPNDHPTMGEFMRDAGYVTGMIGKWDVVSKKQGPLDRGFDQVSCMPPMVKGKRYIYKKQDGSEGFLTDLDGEYLVEFIEKNRDKPFFLYYSPYAIHEPNSESPERYRRRSTATGKRRALAGNLIAVDDAVGRLLDALREYSLATNTLILLTGDNGGSPSSNSRPDPYRGGKGGGTQYEGWVRTSAIVSWPGRIPQGRTYDGLMCTMDFYATAAAVASRPLPKRCDGVDLLPYLRGEKSGDAHEELYWCNDDPKDAPRRHLKAVRWKQWRLVEYDDGWRLFDLKADPREERDLAKKHPEVVSGMRRRYDAWVATLSPVIPMGKGEGTGGGRIPRGYGWATGDTRESFF
ncbi:MAG: sulfatase family protein [Planctomycetota bacterium]|jgi:arylsulfatase A-like enzyme